MAPIQARRAGVGSLVGKCPSETLRQARAKCAGDRVAPDHGGTAIHGRLGPKGAAVMHTSWSAPRDGAIAELDEPRERAMRGPPRGRAGDPAEVTVRLAQDHDRIAGAMNDIVVHRLFSAGLALQGALELMGGHPGAGNVQEAIGELDLAIRDIRNELFDHHQPDLPLGGQPGKAPG